MNATFLKFLQEVLLGLLIMEPNVRKGNGIRRKRIGTLKRILAQSGFMHFGCHVRSIREREREKEQQSQPKNKNRKERKRHMHEHVTCKI